MLLARHGNVSSLSNSCNLCECLLNFDSKWFCCENTNIFMKIPNYSPESPSPVCILWIKITFWSSLYTIICQTFNNGEEWGGNLQGNRKRVLILKQTLQHIVSLPIDKVEWWVVIVKEGNNETWQLSTQTILCKNLKIPGLEQVWQFGKVSW